MLSRLSRAFSATVFAVMPFICALMILVLMTPLSAFAQGVRDFGAEMSAENETKFTQSAAKGDVQIHVDLATLRASWTITYSGLSGPPTTVRLYGPAQPGANGGVIIDLAKPGAPSPITGSAILTEGHVQYLLYGWMYVNLTTSKFKLGEIRGQLDVRAPNEAAK